MTFEEAVRKSMKVYWNQTDDHEELSSSKGRKYTKKYFDSVESEMLNKEDTSKEVLKGKK